MNITHPHVCGYIYLSHMHVCLYVGICFFGSASDTESGRQVLLLSFGEGSPLAGCPDYQERQPGQKSWATMFMTESASSIRSDVLRNKVPQLLHRLGVCSRKIAT